MDLCVASVIGSGGVLFYGRLPPSEHPPPNMAAQSSTSPSRSRLLVVEDDALVRHALVRQLERAFTVQGAAGGDAALARIRTDQFDLVLTDYAMPDRSGVVLARELRAAGFQGPIVMITAVPTALDIPEAIASGSIQAVVPKPWNYRELIQVLEDRLR